MKRAVFLILAAVSLGGPFGSASAELVSRDQEAMTVDIEVEVTVSVQAVVAHLSFDREPDLTLPLLDRGDGVYGLTTELMARNYVVVFDAIGPAGGISRPVTIQELGVDLVPATGRPTTTEPDGLSESTERVGWLAIAFAAASLSALAVWVLGGRDEGDEAGSAEEE